MDNTFNLWFDFHFAMSKGYKGLQPGQAITID